MEVLVGPTFTIDVSSSTAYVMDRAQDGAAAAASCLFLKDAGSGEVRAGFGVLGGGGGSEKSPDVSSASSSSIGEPGDSDDDEDEVSSKPSDGDSEDKPLRRGLGSLGSLEDSLPIKRGLSNHFSGKSKSFANLSEMSRSESTAKDLEKLENPLNKRRRVLIACRWSKKSSFYGWHSNPKSMPLLPSLAEDNDDDDDPDDEDDDRKQNQDHPSSSDQDDDRSVLDRKKLHRTVSKLAGKRRSFKSQSCFALADLHREEDEDHDYQ